MKWISPPACVGRERGRPHRPLFAAGGRLTVEELVGGLYSLEEEGILLAQTLSVASDQTW